LSGLLQIPSGQFYGTTDRGGNVAGPTNGYGTIYKLSMSPAGDAYWPLKEGTGTTASDISGNGNTQSLASSVAWSTSGQYGNCLTFNGTSTSYTNVTNTTFGNFGTNDFSVSCWVNKAAAPASSQYFICKRVTGGPGSLFDVAINSSGNIFAQVEQDSGATNYIITTGSKVVTDGTWHLVTVVRAANKLSVYVDGLLDNYGTSAGTANISCNAPFSLGYLYPSAGTLSYYYVGSLDDVRVYNRALDPSEIESLHNAPQGGWAFNEDGGTSAIDSSSQENNQTLGSDAAWSTSGQSGSCLVFNGASHSYSRMTNTSFGNFGTSDFTVSCWLNDGTAPVSANQYFISKRTTTGHGSLFNACVTTAGKITAQVDQDSSGTNNTVTTGSTVITDGAWHLVTIVRTGATLSVYVDGSLDGSASAAGTANISNAGPLSLGYLYPYPTTLADFYVGSLDDFQVYNRALSVEDIQALYAGPDAYWSFAEASGSVAGDASGNVNTLALTGTTWSNSGIAGNCLSFAGAGSAVANGATFGNFGTGDFSVSAWVNTTNSSSTPQYVVAKRNSTSGNSSFFAIGVTSGKAWAQVDQDTSGTNVKTVTGAASVNNGAWHLITVVRSDATLSLYVDGTLDVSGSGAGTANISNAQALSIGAYTATSSDYFSGLIDDVRVYNYALPSTQIGDLF